MNEPKTNFKPLWFPPDDELKELSAYRPKLKSFAGDVSPNVAGDVPQRTLDDCVQLLLNAGFNHTQIKALNAVGAIKP